MTAQKRLEYRIGGMDCAACVEKISTAVRRVSGVQDLTLSLAKGVLAVRHSADADVAPEIQTAVAALGYNVTSIESRQTATDAAATLDGGDAGASNSRSGAAPSHMPWWKSRKGQMTIACGVALVAAYSAGKLLPEFHAWIFAAAMLVGLVPIARRAIAAAFYGTPFSIEMLMTIAAIGAVVIGASEEAATVVFLFMIGELLEGVAAGKARASIQSLGALVPKTALVERGTRTEEVPAVSLTVDSVVLVRPGDRLAADGVIVSGESAIDEAPVTGESVAVRKGKGSKVFAGTINGDEALRVRVTAAAADNTIARIVQLVEQAQESKAPTERFIDRFSRYYTPAVVAVAALIAVVPPLAMGGAWSEWIYKGLAVLLIGCPCALVISTPAAIAAGLSAGARHGLLLKGGAVLEGLRKITTIAFDKTGTLTQGTPQVTDVVAYGRSEGDVVRLASALEMGSSHPLAKAILAQAVRANIDVPNIVNGKAIGGKGVTGTVDGVDVFLGSAQAAKEHAAISSEQAGRISSFHDEGKSIAVLVAGGITAGLVALRDELRPDAVAGIAALEAAGLKLVMLTGDNHRTAQAIGKQLGIDVRAELLPQDKQRIVGELKRQGQIVAKVGDGINDAPALAEADIGIAMGSGADVALETADAAVLHGRMTDIVAMITLSKRTMANIGQNIVVALGLKAIFLVTTVIGITGLWPAILADTGATVLVTLNSLRLIRFRPNRAVQP